MRVMLVDDEQCALDVIAFLLKDYPDVEVAFASTDPVAALEALK